MATSLLDKLGAKRQTIKPSQYVSNIVEPYRDLGKQLYEEEAFTRTEVKPLSEKLKEQTLDTYETRRDTRLNQQDIERKQEKEVKETASERAKMLERQLSDKYGIKIRRVYSPFDFANLWGKVAPEKREQFAKDYEEYTLEIERSNPFRAGAESGFNVLPTQLETTQGKETVTQAPNYNVGRFVGGAGQQLAFGSVLGAPIEGAVGKVLGTKATPFLTETLKDVAIGTGTQLLEAPFDKPTVGQFATNTALDIALNALFGVVGKSLSKVNAIDLKNAKTAEIVENVARDMNVTAKEASDMIDKSIDDLMQMRTQSPRVEPVLAPRAEMRTDTTAVNLNTKQPSVKISDEVVGAQRGQTDAVKTYTENGTVKGSIEYADTPDEIYIKFIDVKEKRKGIGTKLIEDLYKSNPNKKINWGELTEEGAKLKDSIIEKIENPEYKKAINRISEIDAEIKRLEGLPDENITDEIGDRWNALYDEKSLIEKDLFGIDRFTETFRGKQSTINRPSEFTVKPKKLTEKLAEPTPIPDADPILKKFQLDLFGAKPDAPVEADLGGSVVRVTGVVDENGLRYATLDNGTRVRVDELKPTTITPKQGTGEVKERGFSENIRTDANRVDELRKELDADPAFYQVLSNQSTLESAQARFDKGYDEALKDFELTKTQLRADNVPFAKLLADEATKRGDIETARRIIVETAENLTTAGQYSQAAKILRESNDPISVIRFVNKEIQKLNKKGSDRYGKKWNNIKLNDSELDLIGKITKETTDEEKDIIFNQLFESISNRIPVTNREKFDAWRRIAMLFNPKTHIRNILGNTIMKGVKGVSDKLAQGIEKVALEPTLRTKGAGTKELKKVAENYFDANKKQLTEGSRWEIFGVATPFREKQIFKNQFLNTLDQVSKKTLEAEDIFFFKRNFTNDLAGFMKARNLTEPTEEAVQYALRRSQEATFRQANKIAEAINKMKGSKIGLLVDAAIPFTKTPANILQTGVDYSPIGLAKSMVGLLGNAPPEVAIENLAKGLTGTGLALAGAWAAGNGLARGEYEGGKTEGLYQATGMLPNSIKTPTGSYTIDWAQPVAMPFFMGVAFMEEMKKGGDDKAQAAIDALLAGGETLVSQSMLSGIKDLFSGYGSTTEKIVKLPINYMTQAFPTVAGQIARVIDPNKRQLDYSSIIDSTVTSLQSRTPGLSLDLPVKRDILGQPQKYGEGLLNAFQQFLSPGFIGTKTDDHVILEIQRLYEEVGAEFLPRASVSSFQAEKQKYKLTSEEVSQVQKIMGEYTKSRLESIMNTYDYRSASDEEKAKIIKKANDAGYELAKKTIIEARRK